MIVIKVELHSAITGKVTKLAQMDIHNDGTGTDDLCDYEGRILKKPHFNTITRDAKVIGHRRKQLTVWHLIAKMLKNMGYIQ